MKYTLGSPVRFNTVLKRVTRYIGGGVQEVEWKRREIEETTGIVIGYRTLQNGTLHNYDGDINESFIPDEHVRCVLVVKNLNTNPIRIPIDAVWSA